MSPTHDAASDVFPVIMCGGSGTRLWPASSAEAPKQFAALLPTGSTFQEAARRVAGVSTQPPLVVAGGRHEAAIRSQLHALGSGGQLLIEPEARDSAPAMAAAAAWICARDPEGVAVIVAADHHIPDQAAFREAVGQAVAAARDGWIVTLGVRPTHPASAYGYIRPAASAGVPAAREVLKVGAFVEKPDEAVAADYLRAGYLWNSGNFVVKARVLLEELDRHAPEVAAAARAAAAEGRATAPDVLALGPALTSAPRISIDFAVMERTAHAAVLPVAFAWSDLGAWDAVLAASPRDAAGNAVAGDAILEDVSDCLVRAPAGTVVAAIGVRDLAIVVEEGAVLVCALGDSQKVKQIVARLEARAPAGEKAS